MRTECLTTAIITVEIALESPFRAGGVVLDHLAVEGLSVAQKRTLVAGLMDSVRSLTGTRAPWPHRLPAFLEKHMPEAPKTRSSRFHALYHHPGKLRPSYA